MMRGFHTFALVLVAACCLALAPAAADEYVREELRIPMATAAPRGLEAVLLRPSGTRRYPLALLSHGSPRDATARAGMSPNSSYAQAAEFARRGFAALSLMRRGYGDSDGRFAEGAGPCGRRDYEPAGRVSAEDLKAAIVAMKGRTDVTTDGMIAIGQSAGGFASIALAADPPQGLAAVINFAGGRGSRGANDVCDEDTLVRAFGAYGRTARVPMLWVYTANDSFFRPELVRRFHDAFTSAGGRAQLVALPAFGKDGHSLFSSAGAPVWTPILDNFLREQNLGSRNLIALPAPAALALPPQLSESGRTNFASYLAAGLHKAFAVSPRGGYGYRIGRRSAEEAQQQAMEACSKHSPDCVIYAIDNALAVSQPVTTSAKPSTDRGAAR